MGFWNKARTLSVVAAKSSELTKEDVTLSHELSIGSSRIAEFVSAEATKKGYQIKVMAMKRAELIKSISIESSPGAISLTESIVGDVRTKEEEEVENLERFGVADELRELFRGIDLTTFLDFPLAG